jgi:hypothetical protein
MSGTIDELRTIILTRHPSDPAPHRGSRADAGLWESRCPKRTGTDRVEDMDVKPGESSGVDAPRNKITFLAPRPSGVFYG